MGLPQTELLVLPTVKEYVTAGFLLGFSDNSRALLRTLGSVTQTVFIRKDQFFVDFGLSKGFLV